MSITHEISEFLQKGRSKNVKALVEQALAEGISAGEILNDGLLAGMAVVGAKFKTNEIFVPEVLIAARALNAGLAILEPILVEEGNEPVGKVVIGTVEGDLHDIGKNLVAMMMKGAGFEVVDLGTDVKPETFVEKAEEVGANVIAMSALLTTTMVNMEKTIELLKEKGLREKYVVMVGGAPINDTFAKNTGADYYTVDATSAAEAAKAAVTNKELERFL